MAIRSFFSLMRKSHRVYEKYCQDVIRKWGLNNTSFQVFMFFALNPDSNTARDLCAMRDMKTGIASVTIDQLVTMGLLERKPDPTDRRLQRLYLTDQSRELAEEGKEVQRRYFVDLHRGLTPEELKVYFELTMKLKQTIDEMDRNIG